MSKINTIKALREASGLTRTKFGRAMDVSYFCVYQWENGKTNPSVKSSKKIFRFALERNIQHELDFQKLVGG